MASAGVFIARGAILFIAFWSCHIHKLSWLVSPALPQPLSPRRVKGELSFDGWLSSEASTSRGKEIGVRFQFRTIPSPEHCPVTSKLDSDPDF